MRDPAPFLVAAIILVILGVGMRRPRTALVTAVVVCVVGFVANDAEALAWLFFVFVLPILAGVVLVGQGLAWVLPDRAWKVVLGFAALPLVAGGVLVAHRALLDEVPASVAATLPPSTNTLSGFCFDDLSASDRREASTEVAALIRELPRHGDELTTVYDDSFVEPEDRREELTLRELAEKSLDGVAAQLGCRLPQAGDLGRALRDK